MPALAALLALSLGGCVTLSEGPVDRDVIEQVFPTAPSAAVRGAAQDPAWRLRLTRL
ncbi:hypothetical protein MKK69_13915 [Methylobacterium sp. J-026]|uniref:hypothetical protein n=1 Tax=Methylobacterium sp. J-026 TaxID=2836624 RepID=UPI001FBB8AF1|nr:hypothetical protein [Methylobacterium sp. J-026]MCJ2135137.1 hypothetical protein [Methylobacterium sp. J-026]